MSHEKSHLPNWTGLLGWSTTYHDGTSASQLGPMDSERRKWLEGALDSAFGGQEDPNALIKKAVQEIHENGISAGLDMLDFGSDILECVENIDKLGGLKVMIDLVKSDSPDTVIRASNVLHLYLSNNPRAQIAASVRYDLMKILRHSLEVFRDNIPVINALLSTFGGLVRDVAVLENSFIKDHHIDNLVSLAEQLSDSSCVQKIVALVSYLMTEHSERVSPFAERLIVRVYASNDFDCMNIQFWETASRLVMSKDMKLRHRELLDDRIKAIKSTDNPPEFQQELENIM